MGRISMFCGMENYVLPYKSVYYKVITDYVETYSVFSYSVFFAVVTILCIYSILYIYKYIYII